MNTMLLSSPLNRQTSRCGPGHTIQRAPGSMIELFPQFFVMVVNVARFGFGGLDFGVWIWVFGFGCLDLGIWMFGFGDLDLGFPLIVGLFLCIFRLL